jgi:hypothetical protein
VDAMDGTEWPIFKQIQGIGGEESSAVKLSTRRTFTGIYNHQYDAICPKITGDSKMLQVPWNGRSGPRILEYQMKVLDGRGKDLD